MRRPVDVNPFSGVEYKFISYPIWTRCLRDELLVSPPFHPHSM